MDWFKSQGRNYRACINVVLRAYVEHQRERSRSIRARNPRPTSNEEDFFAWIQLQAKELRRFARTRPNLPLDLAHLAEEIADLGKSQRDSLRSWTRRIIEHLLLFASSLAQERRRGWIAEISNCAARSKLA